MRHYVLLGALIWLCQIPGVAQDTISTNSQSIQGTWISQVADATGNISLFEVGTFSPDGSYSGANVNPSHTTHKGVWLRTGDRKFVLTVMFFTHDDKGVFNGIVKARINLTLAEDLKSYDSVAERGRDGHIGKRVAGDPRHRGTQCPHECGVATKSPELGGGIYDQTNIS
jgi:hypothetical protein